MKTNLFLIAIIIVAIIGCDPVDPPQIFNVSTIVKGHGVVTPAKTTVVNMGSVELTIKPDFGYVIDSVKDGNVVLPSIDKFTYRDVCKDETLYVSFKFPYEKGSIEWMFSQFTWVEVEWLIFSNGYWRDYTNDKTKTTYFYNPDGTGGLSYPGNSFEFKRWYIEKRDGSPYLFISVFTTPSKIESISLKEMILSYIDAEARTVKITYQNDGVRRFPD